MKFVPVKVTRAFGNAVLKTKKNSPHIFFAGGIAGIVVSHVLVARATLKLEPVLDNIKDDIDTVKKPVEPLDDSEYRKDLVHAYARSAIKLGKLYGPGVLVGAVSIGALTKSHVDLSRRNAALAAAYTGLSQMFDEYRERVKEEIGEDKEKDIYLNLKEVEVDENGKKKKIKTIDGLPSQYARRWEKSTSSQWEPAPERNRYFLQCQQNWWNQRLHAYGHVFLNEVYDSLGLERSQIGSVVGWVIDGDGDGYIDFGLYEAVDHSKFDNVLDWFAVLDFNVDGIIYDKI